MDRPRVVRRCLSDRNLQKLRDERAKAKFVVVASLESPEKSSGELVIQGGNWGGIRHALNQIATNHGYMSWCNTTIAECGLFSASSTMKTLNANQLQHASIGANALRSRKRSTAVRPRVDRTAAIAAPERMQQEQQDTIRLLDLERGEQKRLEQTDAFKELVALNKQKQSVNRPQQVYITRFACGQSFIILHLKRGIFVTA